MSLIIDCGNFGSNIVGTPGPCPQNRAIVKCPDHAGIRYVYICDLKDF